MLTLYVHIPFCERKCFYCSFVVSIGQTQKASPYIQCLRREAQNYAGVSIGSVYLGGGTPSLLSMDELKALFRMIHSSFDIAPDAEWTIEANPESVDESKAKFLLDQGINRVSLGIQSMNDAYLTYLGRNHSRAGAVQAVRALRNAGFDNINVDLMYGFPGQTRVDIRDDLERLTELGSDHISLYSLTIEPNSRFYVTRPELPDNDDMADHYVFIAHFAEQCGYGQYEISNFAQPGRQSVHNRHYWTGGAYIGLGVGAHSYMNNERYWNGSKLSEYMRAVESGEDPRAGSELLDLSRRFKERILFGLRMNEGVDVACIAREYQCEFTDEELALVEGFIKGGLLEQRGAILMATEQGRVRLDELCRQLI